MKINYLLILIIGFIIGVVGLFYLGDHKEIVEVEKPIYVEKIVEVEIPRIVEKEVIKEVPVERTVTKTRIVYLPPVKNPVKIKQEEQYCMALNIYREANNQSVAGMIAVARVVMNRVNDRRYPGTPCEVIYEGPHRPSWKDASVMIPVKNRCQFSWYCDGKPDEPVNTRDNIKWKLANDIAYQVLAYDKWNGMVEGSTHYHADYVTPDWSKQLRLVAKIDDHIFYRWE